MKLMSVEQLRALDRRAMEEAGIPGTSLMEKAGTGIAQSVIELIDVTGYVSPFIQLIAGKGNNGGDAFVAAQILALSGIECEVLLTCMENEITGDAKEHFTQMKNEEIPFYSFPSEEEWKELSIVRPEVTLIVDGILGSGIEGAARGAAAGAIEYINRRADEAVIISIDIPSGLNGNTGEAEGVAVFADVTLTMCRPAKGLVRQHALEYVGSLDIIDIGIPEHLIQTADGDDELELIHAGDLRVHFPRRPRTSHKGHFGHVLLIGGSRTYSGAITMAAMAAVRSGAGLVSVLTPASIAATVAVQVPEAMVHAAPENETGSIAMDVWTDWRHQIDGFDAILMGPGMSRHQDTFSFARQMIRECMVPLVVDADAISVFAGQPHWFEKGNCPIVLTPHPGELARLFGQDIDEILNDRTGVAQASAAYTNSTLVLKGAGTVVAHPDHTTSINMTGNPGMAKGGSGDLLAGLITGLIGCGLGPVEAAKAGVYIHGRAGDMAAWNKSQISMTPLDMITEVPYAFRELSAR